jgi:nucleotide-binding universal stress UspA family protein
MGISEDRETQDRGVDVPAGTVVVGVDGSRSAERALLWAADQATAEGRPLTIVHAIGPAESVWLDPTAFDGGEGLKAVETRAVRLLSECHGLALRHHPDLEVHELLRFADARRVLLDLAKDASMVVLGSRGRGPMRSLLLGSVGVAVTRHAACPVVVLRPGNPGWVRRGVLVGVEGSLESREPLEFAYRQASLHDLPLTVVHAIQSVVPLAIAPGVTAIEPIDLEQERLLLAESTTGMAEKYPDVPVRAELVRGNPAERLARMSTRMHLVVVGSHHGEGLAGLLTRSVAAALVEHATCPVAVVPTADRGRT